MKRFKDIYSIIGIALITLTACDSSDDSAGGSTDWMEAATTSTTLRSDVSMSDIDNFVELNLKMENMHLQFAKFVSDGWQGDLYGGAGAHSDPTKMYELLEEILDKKDDYTRAIRNLENEGILDNVTTRGIIASGWDMIVNGWGSTAATRKDKVLDVLEKNKVMGDANAQEELFNSLPTKWKKGETNAQTWFKNLNNGEYNNLCPQLHQYWVTTGAGESSGALAQYSEAAESMSSGNPIHEDAYKVGIEQTEKAASFNTSLWDEATGGYIGKWQDANTIIEETETLRKKIRDGSVSGNDIRKWVVGVGSIYAKEKISQWMPDVSGQDSDPDWVRIVRDMTQETMERASGETIDWLTERAMDEADKSAKDNDVSLTEIHNNIEKSGGSPAVVIVKESDGKVTIGGADKKGETTVATQPGDKTITTVTKDGQRSTQEVQVEAGQNEVDAEPAPSEATAEADPASLSFSSEGDGEVVTVYTNIKYIRANTKDSWIHVSRNAYNILITVDDNDGDVRKGSVLVELSQDKQTIVKTITIPVTQAAAPNDDLSLSFLDADNLRVDMIYSLQLNALGFNTYDYESANRVHIPASDLKITKKSDTVWEAQGRCDISEIQISGDWNKTSSGLEIDESKDYGLHFDMTFTIEAAEPVTYDGYVIDKETFMLKNIKIKGYSKYSRDVYTGQNASFTDVVEEFDWTISHLGQEWGWGSNEDHEQLFSKNSSQSTNVTSTASLTTREWNDYGETKEERDEKGKVIRSWWEPDYRMDTTREAKKIDDIEIVIRW